MKAPRPSAGARHRGAAPHPAPSPIPALAPRDPRFLAVVAMVTGCVLLSVTTLATSTDLWQHLLVGRVIWETHAVPLRHLWSYPFYGQPDVLPSWGFRFLLWPFYALGGDLGLQVWRWLTTLAAFGIGWRTARRLGARGLTPLFVIAVCVLAYRARAQVRPETLVAVLLALQIQVLERRRTHGGGALALTAIAWAWANVHISYFLGFALLAIHALDEWRARRTARPAPRTAGEDLPPTGPGSALARFDRLPLPLVGLLALAVSLANPFGWRALWQPFEYFFLWRDEPIFRIIPELWPLARTWQNQLRSGLPFVMAAWVLLALWRPRGRRFELGEALTCLLFVGLTLLNRRFYGFLMVAAVPYLSRDLSEWAGVIRWPARLVRPGARAALVAAAALLVSIPEWTRPGMPFGIGWQANQYPYRACDFIAQHRLHGPLFNPNYYGGYLLWRFWPRQSLLPFMDVHQSGTREDRDLYTYASIRSEAWDELARRHGIELAMVDGHQDWILGDHLLDFLDREPDWALVFRDDAAALYLRRSSPQGPAADSLAYRVMPGGNEALVALWPRIARDPALRDSLREELERCAAASRFNARAHSNLANLAFLERDRAGARRHLLAALQADPACFTVHRRLGYLLMGESRWREAIREFERECAISGTRLDEYQRMAEAWEKLGVRRRAARLYRRELDLHPGNDAAREGLTRMEGASR
jgi:hypothetical protein